MISMIRSGPSLLMIECGEIEPIIACLEEVFGVDRVDKLKALELSEEGWTVLMFTKHSAVTIDFDDVIDAYIVKEESDTVACKLLSSKDRLPSEMQCRPSARILVLRAIGDMQAAFEALRADFGGVEAGFMENMKMHNQRGTVVVLTEKALRYRTGINDMFSSTLYVEMPYVDLYRRMRVNALRYLNAGMKNRDWYEIEIRIYDRYSAYTLHYDRLMYIIDVLEVGLILGESWGKDMPRPFMEVEVYRLRLLSYLEPKEVKRILMGLEFLSDGTRIVDYDIYSNRKRVGWTDAITKVEKKFARNRIAMDIRQTLLERLKPEEMELLKHMEDSILETRND